MRREIIDAFDRGYQIEELNEDTVKVDICYPRNNKVKYVEVGLSDVRASDGIRVHYDFNRDGYVIEQPRINKVDKGDYVDCVEEWFETAFVQSWALEDSPK